MSKIIESLGKKETSVTYEVSLETIKNMIADDLGVKPEEITIYYVMGDDGDDRFGPVSRSVKKVKVIHKPKK